MTDATFDRRCLLGGAALMSAALATRATAQAAAPSVPEQSFAPKPIPMPFDPTAVAGLSEKLLRSHYDNNYVGAVKRLGAISAQFAALDPTSAPGFEINGLKREELIAYNSMILHEIYFAGLGRQGQPGVALGSAIERDFGSAARWYAEFAGMGKALGGGSGWVILTWCHRDLRLVNQWAADHTMTLAGSSPILVLDMYEHAYAIDYGAKAGAYVDAYINTINWPAADKRFARATA